VEIEDRLQEFRLATLPAGLRRATLAAAKPWRPWYLAAACVTLVACAGVNTRCETRFHQALAGPGAVAPRAPLAGSAVDRFAVNAQQSIEAVTLISLRRVLEDHRQ
jgi:hypothetical protein